MFLEPSLPWIKQQSDVFKRIKYKGVALLTAFTNIDDDDDNDEGEDKS